jgi:hypothetical protein
MDTETKSPRVAGETKSVGPKRVSFTRRDFLLNSAAMPPLIAALFAAPAIVSCGDSSSSSKKSSSGDSGDIEGDISSNHGHSVVITKAEIDDGQAVTLTLTGGTHTHTLDLTMDDVGNIGAGDTVTRESSVTNGHEHDVTFN